jgi:hypothetical protein
MGTSTRSRKWIQQAFFRALSRFKEMYVDLR